MLPGTCAAHRPRVSSSNFSSVTGLSRPTGQAISSYVTLRTYSETNRRWEMAGLAALQPAGTAEWVGEWQDGEMLISATGKDPAGNWIKTKIRFFNIAERSFEWESHASVDDGQTWSRAASLLASRTR